MKLLTTLAHFIKNQKDPLFKRQQHTLQDTLPFTVSGTIDKNEAKNDHKVHKFIPQMVTRNNNNQDYDKVRRKQVRDGPKKAMFSKLTQNPTLSQPVNDAPIIRQKEKGSENSNDLSKIIRAAQLPIDLFNIHKERWKQFGPKNYQHLFKKLHFSFQHPETILYFLRLKQKITDLKLKENDSSHSGRKIAPLILSKEQIINHQEWKQIIQTILKKLKQIEDLSTFNEYLPALIILQKEFHFIPSQIYHFVLARNAQANFKKLNNTHISNLMKILKYKNKVKQHVQLQQKQEAQQQSIEIQDFVQKVAQEILIHPQNYTKDEFLNVFIVINRRKMRMGILTQDLLHKSESTIITYLNQFSFENIFTYMKVYAFFHPAPNRHLLQTLKTALEQKSYQQTNYYSLLMLLHNIKAKKLIFRNLQAIGISNQSISLNADSLLLTVIKEINKCILKFKSSHVIQFLDCCFRNQIKDSIILASISRQVLRHKRQIKLEAYGKALFKLYLLGFKSDALTSSVFKEYANKYHQQMKSLKQFDVFSPPSTEEDLKVDKTLNFKQIHLQQCLIMVIWAFIQQFAQKLSISTNLQSLRSIIPQKLESLDRLPIQLAENINQMLKMHPQMPMINFTLSNSFPQGRLKEFYRHNFSKSQVELLMWEEAHLTNKFVANFNSESQKYLAERWSSRNTYKQEDYIQFCIQFEKGLRKYSCFFDENTSLPEQFLMKRKQVIQKLILKAQI